MQRRGLESDLWHLCLTTETRALTLCQEGAGPRVVSKTVPLLPWNLWSSPREERLENENTSEGVRCYFGNTLVTGKKSAHLFSVICLDQG